MTYFDTQCRRAVFALLIASLSSGCGAKDDTAETDDSVAAESVTSDTSAVAAGSTLTDTTAADSAASLPDSVPVETASAQRGDISSYLVFSSTIATEESVEIHPEIGGRVEAVLAEEGDHVKADQILVQLDDEQALIEDRESEIELNHLEGSYKRTEEMFRRRLISTQESEDKFYQLEQARLRRQKAQLALEHTHIRAPFAGVLTTRSVQVGARVAPGGKLFDLIKLDDLIARVHVPGQYLRNVRVKQVAQIESDFLQDMSFDGYVKRISPVVDPQSGTFKVTLGVRDRWEHLRPGIFVTARIVTDTHASTVLVPKEAIVYDGADRFVFVVRDSTAHRVKLDAGYENNRFVEARSQIDDTTQVIVVGQNGLKDEARIRIVATADDVAAG
ncbi:MAG: efflux RND transporter periplasmic adaptor subunit [Gemmatimonadetes bacterium]|nr:efflux RND transporter periplasmic adaptor subunit [Gemmatimonadota bacterium]MBT5144479.1 efflux RND transporter periplasmic adaptor subunit [Gemmatimonadota bacterium]MBT5587935.1 efflux RND transporter periplasmic adaptor subunit [Gemmatimonadota bacterium]MBT5960272.1 efflux RND transporter periplasmic adaptor subunit [Gemmatimonadota bacterium]MBT6627029.1 efflux RND transporter periplasmic adaptor subunit [Gemmatimonadota bacterium]